MSHMDKQSFLMSPEVTPVILHKDRWNFKIKVSVGDNKDLTPFSAQWSYMNNSYML